MKVLICNTTDTGGGAATAAMRLLEGLVMQGIDVRMLVLGKNTKHPNVFEVTELLEDKPLIRFLYKIKRKINYYYSSYKWQNYPNRQEIALHDIFISSLEDALNKVDFDILNLHWIEGGFINFTELQSIKKPIVWTIHGSFPFTGICHHLLCDRYKSSCGACPALGSLKEDDFSTENFQLKQKRYKNLGLHIVSPSVFMANHARISTLLGNFPINVIPNGIETKLFYPKEKITARDILKINNKKTVLFGAIAATTDLNKGYSILLESMKLLQSMFTPDEIQFLVFGGECTDEFTFEKVNLGLIKDETLMSLVYSAADVMVVPSKHENLPYTIMESLACGTPVTAFRVGGNAELVDHLQNGYLAKPFDALDLANGIKYCLDNNSDGRLSKNSRNKVLENFTIEKISGRYIQLFNSLL